MQLTFEDKEKTVGMAGLLVAETKQWWIKYAGHVRGSEISDIPSHLTFLQYLVKAKEAGITSPKLIGKKKGQFILRRMDNNPYYKQANTNFVLAEHNNRAAINTGSRSFVLFDPDGREYRGDNLYAFAKEHNIFNGIHAVLSGRRFHHKGWTGYYP